MLLSRPKKINYKNQPDDLFNKVNHVIEDSVCVSKLGRTESVRISPDLKKIAYAAFDLNQIILLNVKIKKEIKIEKIIKISCDMESPHDFNWIDNSTIVVANRKGPAVIFKIPADSRTVRPKIKLTNEIANKTNSVAVLKCREKIRLFFCNIFHYISYCDLNFNYDILEEGIAFKKKLKVPDGIAISPSKNKIAVTSALTDEIFVFDINTFEIKNKLISKRPHGISFIDDQRLISTSGNDPFLNIWNLKTNYSYKYRGLSKNEFKLRGNNTEGGVKGIEYCSCLKYLFATCPNSPFLVYKL